MFFSTLTTDTLMLILLLLILAATLSDLLRHIIPNLISLFILLIGIFLHTYLNDWAGSYYALLGLFTGLCIFIPFYIGGGMSAGDVKLMAAIGTILGPFHTLLAAGISLVAGFLIAVILLFIKGELNSTFARYKTMLMETIVLRSFKYKKPVQNTAAAMRIPYAIAISAGTLIVFIKYSYINLYSLSTLISDKWIATAGGVL